jgi:hypothetical protein
MTLRIMAHIIMKLRIMTKLYIMTPRRMIVCVTIFSLMKHSRMTLSIITMSIKTIG